MGSAVGGIEVICLRRVLGGERVDLLDCGPQAYRFPPAADFLFAAAKNARNAGIGETEALGLAQKLGRTHAWAGRGCTAPARGPHSGCQLCFAFLDCSDFRNKP